MNLMSRLLLFFAGDEDCTTSHGRGARSRSSSLEEQTRLPSITPNGIRLGTPVAREAAKSFWSMDMLKTSLNRMAFYADCENHSEASLVSEDSGFQSRAPSERATPTTQLPLLTTSAPSSPCSPRQQASHTGTPHIPDPNTLQQPVLGAVGNSPLLVARREKELRMSSTRNSNSSGSLKSSSSKTISPSLSHTLLPRRQHRRSVSAGHGCQKPSYLPAHKGLRQAYSDTSVSHVQHDPSIFSRLTRNLSSNFNTGF